MAEQSRLNFSISEFVLSNNQTHGHLRKNLGYLWAIRHGAKLIYDLDGDMSFDMQVGIHPLPRLGEQSMLVTGDGQMGINPYATYGNPRIWPRGFPLQLLRHSDYSYVRRLITQPYVQQGISKDCLDLDAMELLVARAPGPPVPPGGPRQPAEGPTLPADIVPLVVPADAYTPINGRNTIFLRKALWGLLIPSTVAASVSDIWRGYWLQSLLHSLGGHVAFVPSPAVLSRPVPSLGELQKRVSQETPLYLEAGRLVRFLVEWLPEAGAFPALLLELTNAMVKAGFLKQADVALAEAWVKDLNTLGYAWPELSPDPAFDRLPEFRFSVPGVFSGNGELAPRQFFRRAGDCGHPLALRQRVCQHSSLSANACIGPCLARWYRLASFGRIRPRTCTGWTAMC
eukprot:jgi/Botrbrau1/10918/Bobra.0025s0091.1